jgi:hypothetical protein
LLAASTVLPRIGSRSPNFRKEKQVDDSQKLATARTALANHKERLRIIIANAHEAISAAEIEISGGIADLENALKEGEPTS